MIKSIRASFDIIVSEITDQYFWMSSDDYGTVLHFYNTAMIEQLLKDYQIEHCNLVSTTLPDGLDHYSGVDIW